MKVDDYGVEEIEDMVRRGGVVDCMDGGCRDGVGVMYERGYVRMKEYKGEFEKYRVGLGKGEVEEGFVGLVVGEYGWVRVRKWGYEIEWFVGEVGKGDVEGLVRGVESLLDDSGYEVGGEGEEEGDMG